MLRNIELLSAQCPLWVNIDADDVIKQYQAYYPASVVHTYHTHFGEYLYYKNQESAHLIPFFGAVYRSDTIHDAIILKFPKSKAELAYTLTMLKPYSHADTKVFVVGENKGGIKTLPKQSQYLLTHLQKVDSARHCLLFASLFAENITKFNLDEWFEYYTHQTQEGTIKVAALPGVFSQKKLDKGTEVLLKNLPKNLTDSVLDFGCGAGIISAYIGKYYQNIQLTLVDVNALALASSEKTLSINNLDGKVYASDALSHIQGTFNHIVSNPPFHQGIKTHYAATESFLSNIKENMCAGGEITLVANSFLKYQPIMQQAIGKTAVIVKENEFTVYSAQK